MVRHADRRPAPAGVSGGGGAVALAPVSDSLAEYLFDARNQLRRVTDKLGAPRLQTTYDYYADGRRARKVVSAWTNGTWQVAATHQFLYDRWNLAREVVTCGATSTTRDYTWGLDLAGLQSGRWDQESGGIGGLLAVTEVSGTATNILLPLCDHIGTIHGLVAAVTNNLTLPAPLLAETRTYSPYGELIEVNSTLQPSAFSLQPCPFGFQSKYYDAETGFWYYGYRFFDSRSGKWLTSDPIQGAGGLNLTELCGGDPVNRVDPRGLAGYFFDGTGNDKDAFDELGRSLDSKGSSAPSHVAALFWMYSGKRAFYEYGVGTRTDKGLGRANGWGARERLDRMFTRFGTAYDGGKGDTDIDILGFSRGAAMAREFANMVHDKYPAAQIRFVGMFDTVAQIGVPDDFNNNPGVRTKLPVEAIGYTAHAVAKGEKRSLFPLTSIAGDYGLKHYGGVQLGVRPFIPVVPRKYASSEYVELRGDKYWEKPFEGAHSDVGGGYGDGTNIDALRWMFEVAIANGVPLSWSSPEFQKRAGVYRMVPLVGGERQWHDSRWPNDRVPFTAGRLGRWTRRIYSGGND